jgi:hypothetical protein
LPAVPPRFLRPPFSGGTFLAGRVAVCYTLAARPILGAAFRGGAIWRKA